MIPFGEVRSYADVAKALDADGDAGRAANGRNAADLYSCHRVIASDGALAGFSAGIEVKRIGSRGVLL